MRSADVTLGEMLGALCGVGVGGGIGGACFDCDSEEPLSDRGLSFGVVPLNTYVRFGTPGNLHLRGFIG
jgi:hypothetical protein